MAMMKKSQIKTDYVIAIPEDHLPGIRKMTGTRRDVYLYPGDVNLGHIDYDIWRRKDNKRKGKKLLCWKASEGIN